MALSPRVLTLLDAEGAVATGSAINNIGITKGYTVQLTGTFVGTVEIQGSFDGVLWSTLASKTAPEMFAIDLVFPYVRGKVTAYTSGSITAYAMYQ